MTTCKTFKEWWAVNAKYYAGRTSTSVADAAFAAGLAARAPETVGGEAGPPTAYPTTEDVARLRAGVHAEPELAEMLRYCRSPRHSMTCDRITVKRWRAEQATPATCAGCARDVCSLHPPVGAPTEAEARDMRDVAAMAKREHLQHCRHLRGGSCNCYLSFSAPDGGASPKSVPCVACGLPAGVPCDGPCEEREEAVGGASPPLTCEMCKFPLSGKHWGYCDRRP